MNKLNKLAESAAVFARQLEGIDTEPINIANLQLEEADNGYKKVTFYYKVSE
jgi:hypothetical protein